MAAEGFEALAARIRELSGRMQAAAEAGEWEALPQLAETRGRLFDRLAVPDQDREALRALLEETLAADLLLRELAQKARDEIAERLRELARARRGAAAYAAESK